VFFKYCYIRNFATIWLRYEQNLKFNYECAFLIHESVVDHFVIKLYLSRTKVSLCKNVLARNQEEKASSQNSC